VAEGGRGVGLNSTVSPHSERLTPKLSEAELRALSEGGGQEPLDAALDGLGGNTQLLEDYVFLEDVLSESAADAVERLAKTEAGWKLNEKWFLSKHDVVWARQTLGKRQSGKNIAELAILRNIGKQLIEEKYNAVVGTRLEIKATKMVAGQAVGVHNDSPDGARGRTEGYRLLYYPNREYIDSDGGHLFFYGSDAGPIIGGVRPVFNSGVLMRLSDRSYHAVSRVTGGARYTVAVLYWGYPILFDDRSKRAVVAQCLRKIIASKCEEVKYGTTTIADHRYHTYRLLVEWGAPLDVCLAGLMRPVPEVPVGAGQAIDLLSNEIAALVGPYVVQLIGGLNAGTSINDDRLDKDMKLVRLAAMLEQAEEEQAIARACRFIEDIGSFNGEIGRRIEIEVSRLRAEVVQVGD